MGVMPGEPPRVPIPAYNTAGEILLIGVVGYRSVLRKPGARVQAPQDAWIRFCGSAFVRRDARAESVYVSKSLLGSGGAILD